jgi:hypothetical protein
MNIDGESLLAYCEAWWKDYRPCAWGEKEHLENPDVNMPDENARILARYIADLIKRRNGEKNGRRTS